MIWARSRSSRALTIIIASSGLAACEVTDLEDEELLDTELRSQERAPCVLLPEADTVVRADRYEYRDDNFGCTACLSVGTGDTIRSLLRFDLDEVIPRRVWRATLALTLTGCDGPWEIPDFTIDAHRVIPSRDRTPWMEGSGSELPSQRRPPECSSSDEAEGVDWSTQPDFAPAPLGRIVLDRDWIRHESPYVVVEMDMTDVVNDWLSGRAPNEGIVLRDVVSDGPFRELHTLSRAHGLDWPWEGMGGPRLVLEKEPPFLPVWITAVGLQTTLSWTPLPGATYSVYRGNRFDFEYTDPDAHRMPAPRTRGRYTETFGPYDPAAFYQVVEDVSGHKRASAVLGRLPVPVRRSPSSAYGNIPLCLVPTPADALQLMLQDDQLQYQPPQYEESLSFHWWEPHSQSYADDGPPFEAVRGLEMSEFFSVRTPAGPRSDYAPYHVTGRVPERRELFLPMVEGINTVVWPLTAERISARDLVNDVQGVFAVGRWNLIAQAVEWYTLWGQPPSVPGLENTATSTSFQIEPCTPLYIYINYSDEVPAGQPIPVVWPPAEPQ